MTQSDTHSHGSVHSQAGPACLEIESPGGRQVVHIPRSRQALAVAEILRQAGLPLNTRCGQRGLCDGCMVELISGTLIQIANGQTIVREQAPLSVRACAHRLDGSGRVCVRVPPRSLLAYQPQIVTDFRINVPRAQFPLLQTVELAFADLPAGLALDAAVCQCLARRMNLSRPVNLADSAAAQLRNLAGAARFFVTLEFRPDHWLVREIAAQAGQTRIGAAIDIGTTTVAVLLADLGTGRMLARSAAFNQQIHLGDDVVTRITLCANDAEMTRQLQEAVAHRTIAPLLEEAARQANLSAGAVECLSIAGNTTMLHLLVGVDPTPLGTAPFTPVFVEHRALAATELLGTPPGQAFAPAALFHLLPSAAAYIGADLTAGIVASGLLYDDGPSLLVDVGTNGEVILKHGDRLLGCATAAGPAFEGAGLSCGIRAGDGAISHIHFEGNPPQLTAEWIGQGACEPTGICGSAYVDFLAEGRRIGLLGPTGRFSRGTSPALDARLLPWRTADTAFRLASGQGKREIVISQQDISRLLQAKAAIAAGILSLLEKVGLAPADVRTLYLAGGFGMHIDPDCAIACGLLPGFTSRQIQPVGNTALAGAYLALLDAGILDELAAIGRRLEVIELNLDPGFESRYIDQLPLPEPMTEQRS